MPASSPLALLRSIRDIMSAPVSAQGRLDQVVKAIADGLHSDVCSVYLLRAGDVLELFASVGLNPGSVHLTRLHVGQGLVGEIAATEEPLNLAEAALHPKFVYRPETGEELYHSFVGVPILHGGRAIGVLVAQGREARAASQEQLDVLQTVAMVLSELAISNQFVNPAELENTAASVFFSAKKAGVRLSGGMAVAPAVVLESRHAITQLIANDANHEQERLTQALEGLQRTLEALLSAARYHDREEEHEILEAYLLLTQDKGWRARIDEAIGSGLTAEAAIRKVEQQLHARLHQAQNTYARERMQDLEEISNRLIAELVGHEPAALQLPEQCIVVARNLGPAELLKLDAGRIRGIVLEEGSPFSHIAILARAMDIPALANVERATTVIRGGDKLALDADSGEVHIRPGDETLLAIEAQQAKLRERKARYRTLEALPSVTKDGIQIALMVNAGLGAEKEAFCQEGVEGIGLYRTELPYMASAQFPSMHMQVHLYREVLASAQGKAVIFRSFDIGGDKTVPYFSFPREDNPAMGWRGARLALDRPRLLLDQLEALLIAAGSKGETLYVMFPFVAQVSELKDLKRLLARAEMECAVQGKVMPERVSIGVMLEIPSLLWELEALLAEVDFLALGSNDMAQFFFAADRGSEASERYDPLAPAFLTMVRHVAAACEKAGVEMLCCGDMARKPLDALALIASGVRRLSMPASSIPAVKEMIRSLHLTEAEEYLAAIRLLPVASLRSRLREFANAHSILV